MVRLICLLGCGCGYLLVYGCLLGGLGVVVVCGWLFEVVRFIALIVLVI